MAQYDTEGRLIPDVVTTGLGDINRASVPTNMFGGTLNMADSRLADALKGTSKIEGLTLDPLTGSYGTPSIGGTTGGDSWWGQQDWGMKGLGGTAVGLGQLGVGLLGYLENKKTADKQRELMDQQMEANEYAMNKSKKSSAGLARAFGTA